MLHVALFRLWKMFNWKCAVNVFTKGRRKLLLSYSIMFGFPAADKRKTMRRVIHKVLESNSNWRKFVEIFLIDGIFFRYCVRCRSSLHLIYLLRWNYQRVDTMICELLNASENWLATLDVTYLHSPVENIQ